MTFISHAQNFEDVMLWRALKHVEQGFYVDIGAAWPNVDSVTKAFYERGWQGINVEPNLELCAQLSQYRPRDINLKLAVGEREGTLTLNLFADTGLSTLDDDIADKHRTVGWSANRQEVGVTTLAAIWEAHVPVGQEVHFLKVDVEGFEEAVLKGNDWAKHRPWVVIVEATLPMTQAESHETWEPILFAANYQFAYADGLNRFYVAHEHLELLPAFKYPPNVFDDFLLYRQQEAEDKAQQAEDKAQQAEDKAQQAEDKAQQAEDKAQQAEDKAQQAEDKAQQAEDKAQQAEDKAQQAEAASTQALMQLQAVYTSTSWRFTAPLRAVSSFARKLSPKRLKPVIKQFLKHAALYVNRRPRLRKSVVAVLNRFPAVKYRLVSVVNGAYRAPATPPPATPPSVPLELAHLSPHARRIHADLTAALARRQQGGR